MTGSRRLPWLVAAHIALGVVAGVLAPVKLRNSLGLEHILIVPLFASAMCQALLMALWVATSSSAPKERLVGLIAGTVFLEALFASDLRREFLGLATVTVLLATTSLLVVRWLGVRLARPADPDRLARGEGEGLRFTIRGLMIFVAAVALLSAGTRALREAGPGRFLLQMVIWSLCFVVVGLVALWAALGSGRPLRRGPVLFALAPALGVFFAVGVDAHRAGWVYILLTMMSYPALLLGSLLVVRSCGYRLVRRFAPSTIPAGGGEDGDGLSAVGSPEAGVTTSE